MPGKTGLVFLFFLLVTSVTAQGQQNFAEVDKKSYDLLLQEKWEELISYCSKARTPSISKITALNLIFSFRIF